MARTAHTPRSNANTAVIVVPHHRYHLRGRPTTRNPSRYPTARPGRRAMGSHSEDASSSEGEDHEAPALQELSELKKQLEALATENVTIRAELDQSRACIVNKVSEALNTATTCVICQSIMRRPFTLQCSHSFCAPCLRQWFRTRLGMRLARIPYLLRRVGDAYNCRLTPRDNDHLAYLLAVLGRYRVHSPRILLAYPCPTCRRNTTVAPVESLIFKDMIAEVNTAIGIQSVVADQVDEGGVATSGYFDGLFYDLDLALRPPHLPISRLFT